MGKESFDLKTAVEQIIGREGETATFLSRFLVNSNLRVGGFAPRHLNRSTFSVKNKQFFQVSVKKI